MECRLIRYTQWLNRYILTSIMLNIFAYTFLYKIREQIKGKVFTLDHDVDCIFQF